MVGASAGRRTDHFPPAGLLAAGCRVEPQLLITCYRMHAAWIQARTRRGGLREPAAAVEGKVCRNIGRGQIEAGQRA